MGRWSAGRGMPANYYPTKHERAAAMRATVAYLVND
jgi:hypothetical protein